MKVACVEKRATPGGTCLNVGCIPSKALLHASRRFARPQHGFAAIGIKVQPEARSRQPCMASRTRSSKGMTQGVEFLFKKNKIDRFSAAAGSRRRQGRGDRTRTARSRPSTHAASSSPRARRSRRCRASPSTRRRSSPPPARSSLREGPGAPGGDRRRLYRARARLGVAAARRQGDRGRVPRPHHARHGRRGGQAVPADPRRSRASHSSSGPR